MEPLTPAEAAARVQRLGGWRLVDGQHLEKRYEFDDFAGALAFVNRVGAVAEAAGHHPDIELGWGRAVLRLRTHDIGGLSEADFELAAEADRVRPA